MSSVLLRVECVCLWGRSQPFLDMRIAPPVLCPARPFRCRAVADQGALPASGRSGASGLGEPAGEEMAVWDGVAHGVGCRGEVPPDEDGSVGGGEVVDRGPRLCRFSVVAVAVMPGDLVSLRMCRVSATGEVRVVRGFQESCWCSSHHSAIRAASGVTAWRRSSSLSGAVRGGRTTIGPAAVIRRLLALGRLLRVSHRRSGGRNLGRR
jgi:hypothetical protein